MSPDAPQPATPDPAGESSSDPLAELLADPERRPIPGAAPLISVRDDDEDEFNTAVASNGLSLLELERRGAWHGRAAELPLELDPRAKLPRPSLLRKRWREARPILLARALRDCLPDLRNELHNLTALHERLEGDTALAEHLSKLCGRRGSAFKVVEPAAALDDPERDLAKVVLAPNDAPELRVWVKHARLSNHAEDRGARLRIGHGEEGRDDAALDPKSRRTTARLARELLPVRGPLDKHKALWSTISAIADEVLEPAEDIAYWNRPGSGARFHHDAFSPDDAEGQRGALFTQWVGRTLWLALSVRDLAERVLEFAAGLEPGPLMERFEATGVLSCLAEFGDNALDIQTELALPGAGRLGPLVDHGPEFTGFLIDSGHGAVLHPGDALLLPNHGLGSTVMHSVFSASRGTNFGLSQGLFTGRASRRRR